MRQSASHWRRSLAATLLLLIAVSPERIFLDNMPANPVLVYQLQSRLNRLLAYLQGNPRPNPWTLYLRVKACRDYLMLMEEQALLDYDNLVLGQGNRAAGVKNVVFGARNSLQGHRNWVFSADFRGAGQQKLVIDRWSIDLSRIEAIKLQPALAISEWRDC